MFTTHDQGRSLRRLTGLGLACLSLLAPQLQAQEPVEEIVITGSRIAAPNLSEHEPGPGRDREGDQAPRQDGHVRRAQHVAAGVPELGDRLLEHVQLAFNARRADDGRTCAVSAPQRTLVLVDGRRLGSADANTGNPNPSPNLDQIPVQMIERVDVVTGGASAVYGSDAIAGVVNFIMSKNFEGVQIDAQYGFYQHDNNNGLHPGSSRRRRHRASPTAHASDGENFSVSIMAGANIADGRGNVTGYLLSAGGPDHGLRPRLRGLPGLHRADRDSRRLRRHRELKLLPPRHQPRTPTRSWATSSCRGRRQAPPRQGSSTPTLTSTCRVTTSASWPASWATSTSTTTFDPYVEFGFMNDQTRGRDRAVGSVPRLEPVDPPTRSTWSTAAIRC